MTRYTSNYTWLESKFGKAIEAHQEFGKALQEAGPIAGKEAQLIQLAGAAAVRSEGAVHSHVKRALAAGAQPGEIYHTLLLLSSTIGFPATAAAISWAREIIKGN
jgi:alkylhydroperoxidase/carboxymuconolactone decarboxylase family protein YurZ